MPILTPHWDIMKENGLFRAEAGTGSEMRFPVLISLIGRANIRLRCWPGVDTLMLACGVTHKQAISAAINWLFTHGAIYNVPVGKREGKEKWLLPQKYVFQLTGIIELNGVVMEYILMQDGEREAMIDELSELGAEYAVSLYGLLDPKPAPDPEGEDKVGGETPLTKVGVGGESYINVGGETPLTVGGESYIRSSTSLSSTKKAVTHPIPRSASQSGKRQVISTDLDIEIDEEVPAVNPNLLTALAVYLQATTGNTLTTKHMKRLNAKIKINRGSDSLTLEYKSPEYMYVNERGFSQFVNSRLEMYKAKSGFDKMDTIIGDICKYGRNNPGGQPGWLAWKAKHPEFTTPLPANADVPVHQQRIVLPGKEFEEDYED